MSRHRIPYAAEFWARMVKAGRTPEEQEKKFEPTAQTIYKWVARTGREAGMQLSMGTAGDAYDSAMYESFFGTLEAERLHAQEQTPSQRGLPTAGSVVVGTGDPQPGRGQPATQQFMEDQ